MEEILHQLRLVVYTTIYKVLYIQTVVGNGISINSINCTFKLAPFQGFSVFDMLLMVQKIPSNHRLDV